MTTRRYPWLLERLFCVLLCSCFVSTIQRKGHLKPLGEQRESDGTIDSLKYSPSSQDFYHRWLQQRKPLIIRDAANHWPARTLWQNETYLRAEHGDIPFTVEFRKTFTNSYPVRKTILMKEFLDIYKTESIYLDSTIPPCRMINELILPTLFHCKEINSKISSVGLLFVDNEASSAFHHDGYENVLVLLSGTKKVILVDSSHSDLAYGDQFSLLPGISPINPDNVDLEKFPKIAEMPFLEATLHAGDVLYIPQYWWHHVRSSGSPNIAINIWFNQFDYEHLFPEAGIREDTDVVKVAQLFDEKVKEEVKHIRCTEEKPSLAQFLKVDPDDPMQAHLRIPKKNQRPEDITLASGYQMPVMGFGTCCLGKDTLPSIQTALEVGYRMFDTAQGYPGVEESLAEAMKQTGVLREDVFIIAKLHPRFLGYESTLSAVEESLSKLQTDYIDLFLIHTKHCDDHVLICPEGEPKGSWVDSWHAMEELHRQGKLRSLGVSNFNINDLEKIVTMTTVPLSAVENWFDPFHQERSLREFCVQHNIRFIGYSTLGTQWVFYGGLKENPVLTSELIWDVAAHYEFVTAQIVLRWAIHQNVTVIPRSSNPRNIALNFRALDFNLNSMEIELITNISDYLDDDEEEDIDGNLNEGEKEKIISASDSDGEGTGGDAGAGAGDAPGGSGGAGGDATVASDGTCASSSDACANAGDSTRGVTGDASVASGGASSDATGASDGDGDGTCAASSGTCGDATDAGAEAADVGATSVDAAVGVDADAAVDADMGAKAAVGANTGTDAIGDADAATGASAANADAASAHADATDAGISDADARDRDSANKKTDQDERNKQEYNENRGSEKEVADKSSEKTKKVDSSESEIEE